MRVTVSLVCLVAGLALAAVSYLALAAPLGLPRTEAYSNPRVPFAAGLFVIGIVLA
ncbi:MAG: hypothetical protein HY680_11565, partial [Chloroflexi bacterium]|nr:hypothetical protein [Chloroflexota bacterium]